MSWKPQIANIRADFSGRLRMAAGDKDRISKAEALGFLLTHIVVERGISLEIDQLALFELNSVAQRAIEEISTSESIIPHEVIESLAAEYLDNK